MASNDHLTGITVKPLTPWITFDNPGQYAPDDNFVLVARPVPEPPALAALALGAAAFVGRRKRA